MWNNYLRILIILLLIFKYSNSYHINPRDDDDEYEELDLSDCEGFDGEFIASKKSCSYFIYCDEDDPYEGECPDDMHFNTAQQTCDLPENANCRIEEATTTTTTTTTEKPTTTTTTTTTQKPTSSVTTTTINDKPLTTTEYSDHTTFETTSKISSTLKTTTMSSDDPYLRSCPAFDDPENIILLPSKRSCSEYYLCYHGASIQLSCADHLHFNALIDKCDFPEQANCQLNEPIQFEPECSSRAIQFFPHHEHCEYFYYCIFGHLTVQQCPFYHYWDQNEKRCKQQNLVKCYSRFK